MNLERRKLNESEGDPNLEFAQEARDLDENSQEVAELLENSDLEKVDPQAKKAVNERLLAVLGSLMTIAGAAFAYSETQGIDFSSIKNIHELIQTLGATDFFAGTGIALAGVSNLLCAYQKAKKYIP